MGQDINHRAELINLSDELLEKIAHHCKGEARVSKGHSIRYHQDRGTMARNILNERKLQDLLDNTRPIEEINREELGKSIESVNF